MFKILLLGIICFSAVSLDVNSLEVERRDAKFEQLKSLRHTIETINYRMLRGFIPTDSYDKYKKLRSTLFILAGEIAGVKDMDMAVLMRLTQPPPPPPPSTWNKVTGFVTFTNIIAITAAILFVGSLAWLTRLYLLVILLAIPAKVHEFLIYLACALLIVSGNYVKPEFQILLILPGCLGIIGGLSFTHWLRFVDKEFNMSVYFWILTAVWSCVAVVFGSEVVGFMSCMSLLSALGFMAGMLPGVISVGFNEEELIPRATLGAFALLTVHVIMSIFDPSGLTIPQYAYFAAGFSFMGSFVYFLGLICLSWRYYTWGLGGEDEKWGRYIRYNVLAVVSGIAALYLGSVFSLGMVLGVCGTFFYIYLIEKYYELPWDGRGWAWSLLGLAGILYCFVIFAKANPHYFIFAG